MQIRLNLETQNGTPFVLIGEADTEIPLSDIEGFITACDFKLPSIQPTSARAAYAPPTGIPSVTPAPQAANWACPFHGTKHIRPGYRGNGWECAVFTGSPAVDDPGNQWVKEKAFVTSKGESLFYCRHNSRS